VKVLKPMVFNRGSGRLFLRFKNPREHLPHGWFSGGNCNPR